MKNQLKIFNKPKKKAKLCALGLTGIMIATGLTGCGCVPQNVNDNIAEEEVVNKIDVDSIFLNIGDNIFSLKVSSCNRFFNDLVDVTLADGSKIRVNEKNVIPYNQYSSILNQMKDKVICIDQPKTKKSYHDPNTMLVNMNNKIYKIHFKNYNRLTEKFIKVTLDDSSIAYINEFNCTLYNDASPMMKQIEEIAVDQSLTKANQKVK